MTPLGRLIATRIAAEGPISLADYMADCLMHPVHGYYATRDPFGSQGDFTTAPEISQMFGELLGLCLAQAWMDQVRPLPFRLVELGPGRGTLMADMLRALGSVPGLHGQIEVALVEASPKLRAVQKERLQGHKVQWLDRLDDLADGPLFLVANEFFDALPIRQFVRADAGWSERMVGLKDGLLTLGLGPATPYGSLAARLADTRPGDLVELCPALAPISEEIARRIATNGGAALVIDYGGWHSLGDTLQALKDHRPTDPFAAPGEADLTAHVDFEALSLAFTRPGARPSRMVSQGLFLERLGIGARAERLAAQLQGAALDSHLAAYRRLTDTSEMGELFKVIACHPAGAPPPPGLDPI
ncbi:SAM-dependent methyltransferase [Frigidibacter sp. RF13]|uniref:class I SAM-dependent methyltransferase n=1 Tax=Frigidibacter sp. RF13 TaxID=2997340 RepID=UPI002271D914|nr:SAM-dependent methyltransferase [Frigidibacter sp. RF13]MCY1126051.1 SAM-dependent methyltransferase [Frigidibacter sp. RF13]